MRREISYAARCVFLPAKPDAGSAMFGRHVGCSSGELPAVAVLFRPWRLCLGLAPQSSAVCGDAGEIEICPGMDEGRAVVGFAFVRFRNLFTHTGRRRLRDVSFALFGPPSSEPPPPPATPKASRNCCMCRHARDVGSLVSESRIAAVSTSGGV